MGTVQYRVEPNPLTKPASYKLRFMPKQTAGYDELAAAVAKDTGLSAEQAKAFLLSAVKNIKEMLCNGMQVTLEEALTFAPCIMRLGWVSIIHLDGRRAGCRFAP